MDEREQAAEADTPFVPFWAPSWADPAGNVYLVSDASNQFSDAADALAYQAQVAQAVRLFTGLAPAGVWEVIADKPLPHQHCGIQTHFLRVSGPAFDEAKATYEAEQARLREVIGADVPEGMHLLVVNSPEALKAVVAEFARRAQAAEDAAKAKPDEQPRRDVW